MPDTMMNMDYVKVDILTAGQLEIDDLIVVNDEVVSLLEIISLADGYTLEIINDFGEREIIQVGEYEQFDLIMLQ